MTFFRKVHYKILSYLSTITNGLYERWLRIQNKNYNFTILCSNCIGGIISNRLGLQFKSPTVNLFIPYKDFYRFVKNPQYYLSLELEFFEDSQCNYPVAMLGDVRLNFNHYKSEREAKDSWNRRKDRINWNNIYIITYERFDIDREDILSLADIKCRKLIILTEKKENLDIPYVKYIKRNTSGRDNSQVFLDKDNFGIRTFEKQWDFVRWLNT